MPRRTFSCLRGLAVVRSTLPWNFASRSAPYAYLWSEVHFYHFEPTELHSKASEWPESLNSTRGRCTGPVDPFPAIVGLRNGGDERQTCLE